MQDIKHNGLHSALAEAYLTLFISTLNHISEH